MKLALYALAASAAVLATPATAATVVYTSGNEVALAYRPITDDYDGAFRFRIVNTTPGDPNGDFTAELTFTSPFVGLGSSQAGSVIVRGDLGSDVDFFSLLINGVSGGVSNGPASSAFVIDAPVNFGSNTLTINGRLNPNGDRTGDGLVTGSLTIAAVAGAVPEPATWALFIMGFGAIGGALRRRSGAVRVSKAKLNFA